MAKITTITNPLTGQPAQVDQLDHTAQEIDDAISRALPGGAIDITLQKKVNPNLLDNWYFGNPVNQRGQTSYTVAGYVIDRWLSGNERGTFTVEADGITFSANSSGTAYFRQFIENGFSLLKGKTVSLTILYADNSLVTLTGAIPTVSGEATIVTTNLGGGSFGLLLSSDGNLFVQLARLANYSIKVYAIKLELGSQQTLAHQENGNWVLNEIPDYGEQLARCQRYFYAFNFEDWPGVGTYWGRGTSSTEMDLYNLTFPVTMRVNPSVKMLRVYDVVTGETFDVVTNGYNNKKEGFHAITITSGMTVTVDRTYIISKAQFSADL